MIFFGFHYCSFATPFPGMGSSVLVQPESGVYLASRGYTINIAGSNWLPQQADPREIGMDGLSLKQEAQSVSLTLKLESYPEKTQFEQYAKKWMKEYSQYGFEVLGYKQIKLNGNDTLYVDLIHKNSDQQLRQVLIRDPQKKVAIFTCKDQRSHFESKLAECNKIVSSFKWSQQLIR